MKDIGAQIACLLVAMVGLVAPVHAQDTVTVSKSRLEELERKEAELERLKREIQKGVVQPQAVPAAKLKAGDRKETPQSDQAGAPLVKEAGDKSGGTSEVGVAAIRSGADSKPAPSVPPIATLAPLAQGQVVDAMDLLEHYRTEPAAAAKRYETERIRLEGEVVGFEKPNLVRHYVILLRTPERDWEVVCRVDPPAELSAVFTANRDLELVGVTPGGTRSVLARVGQRVLVEGWCKGLKKQKVALGSARLLEVR